MTTNSLNDLCQFINEQSYQREELAAYLCQLAALIKVALTACFQEQEESDQYDYLWAVSNLLDTAKAQNEVQLKALMTQATLLEQQAEK
jgi:hypothetical protein